MVKMPLEVSSLLSRLRFRPSNHPVVAATVLAEDPTVSYGRDSITKLQLEQRILQNPDSYIDSGDSSQPPIVTGGRPADSGVGLPHPRRTRYNSEQVPESDTHGSCLAYTQTTSEQLGVEHASRVTPGGEWSTFGRKSARKARSRTPQSSHRKTTRSLSWRGRLLNQDHVEGGIPSDNSVFTSGALNAANPTASCEALPSSRSAASARESHCSRSTSSNSSPADTLSSRRRRRTDHIAGLPLSSHVHSTTPSSPQSASDSPRTFGHPTPPDNTSALKPACSPPPLPPLDHPELAAALAARNKVASATQSAFSNIPPRRSCRDPFTFMPSTFARPHGKRASFPGIREVFDTGTQEQEQQRKTHVQQPSDRRRTRTVPGRPQNLRRYSAEWSAQQAVSGITSSCDRTWPAEVSREILRLSLGEGPATGGGPGGVSGSSAKNKSQSQSSQTRGHGMHDFPDRAPISPSSSFFPSTPPPARVPGLPKGPVALPDPSVIAPRIRRSSTSLYRLSLRRRSGLGDLKMAQVMRSLSAIEPRHDLRRTTNASHEPSSSSLGRSASATTTPARSQLLHVYSADTPSRTILQGSLRATDDAPATPTPAPKYLSDKSRGKRKADDIDTTPPELKKEGQRATFVIPSETRSQRISNSSHAPSSYHRKRARISSVSPFATPAHSRPPSIQEQTASNGHQLAWPSNTTSGRGAPPRTPSRGASVRSQNPSQQPSPYRKSHDRRQSMSQTSIPISALVSPHAPSVSTSTKFHMRDPRRPPKKLKDTEWSLRFATRDEPGSPSQAWLFFMGFILFPLWWIAAFCIPIPKTRTVGDASLEKAVTVIDDPQIEHDAKSWRLRCRVMAVVSAFTYIPFIALVAIFVRR